MVVNVLSAQLLTLLIAELMMLWIVALIDCHHFLTTVKTRELNFSKLVRVSAAQPLTVFITVEILSLVFSAAFSAASLIFSTVSLTPSETLWTVSLIVFLTLEAVFLI